MKIKQADKIKKVKNCEVIIIIIPYCLLISSQLSIQANYYCD